jgi:multidrug resistance efflux pump
MKFGRQGIMILALLGGLALVLAIFSPALFKGTTAQAVDRGQATLDWSLASKGVIESKNDVAISSQITGMIKDVLADEGDRVKAGQPILLFDDAKMLAKLELAEAVVRQKQAYLAQLERGYLDEDIEAAQRVFERKRAIFNDSSDEIARMEQLFKTEAVTKTDRDQARRDYDVGQAEMREAAANLKKLQRGTRIEEIASARADVDKARAELKFSQVSLLDYAILSPIDGLVIERSAETGETVDVGTPLFTIIDPDKLHVWAEIEETDAGRISPGRAVFVEVDAFPDKQYPGEVTQVLEAVQRKRQKSFDPVATFDINTQKVLIELEGYSGLVHGLTVTVLFTK